MTNPVIEPTELLTTIVTAMPNTQNRPQASPVRPTATAALAQSSPVIPWVEPSTTMVSA